MRALERRPEKLEAAAGIGEVPRKFEVWIVDSADSDKKRCNMLQWLHHSFMMTSAGRVTGMPLSSSSSLSQRFTSRPETDMSDSEKNLKRMRSGRCSLARLSASRPSLVCTV